MMCLRRRSKDMHVHPILNQALRNSLPLLHGPTSPRLARGWVYANRATNRTPLKFFSLRVKESRLLSHGGADGHSHRRCRRVNAGMNLVNEDRPGSNGNNGTAAHFTAG